ncbi:hypothetical protein, partial [Mesorhizobium sp. LNHC229A00]|uniref:hypothetical protein n=1 Tax=Mesorhizobium sp. LNHC229A00 TaxID=1287240 RepID=UPI001AEC6249
LQGPPLHKAGRTHNHVNCGSSAVCYLPPMNKTKLTLWVVLAVLIVIGIYLFMQADAPDWSVHL